MDPISAMRMPAMGSIFPSNLPTIEPPQIQTDELKSLGNIGPAQPFGTEGAQAGRSFSDFLGEMVQEVNAKQRTSATTVEGVLAGQNIPLHQAMLAMEEASISFQLMVEVRNKLLESYQELMRMQI